MISSYYYLLLLTTKMVSCCQRTLWDEGRSVASCGIGGSVDLLLRVQSPFILGMGGR